MDQTRSDRVLWGVFSPLYFSRPSPEEARTEKAQKQVKLSRSPILSPPQKNPFDATDSILYTSVNSVDVVVTVRAETVTAFKRVSTVSAIYRATVTGLSVLFEKGAYLASIERCSQFSLVILYVVVTVVVID